MICHYRHHYHRHHRSRSRQYRCPHVRFEIYTLFPFAEKCNFEKHNFHGWTIFNSSEPSRSEIVRT